MGALLKIRHKWTEEGVVASSAWAAVLLVLSLAVNYFAASYAAAKASNKVSDLLLDVLPLVNVKVVVFQSAIVFVLALVVGLLLNPSKLPFTVKSLALFIFIRSFFLVMTHMSPPLGLEYQREFFRADELFIDFVFGADLFFSGHTGIPFLLALVFWQQARLRVFFLAASVIGAVSVLLGHLHYTIDVFAAFFITYAIFVLCKKFFKKDYELFSRNN